MALVPNMRGMLYEDAKNVKSVVERIQSTEDALPRVLDEDS